MTNASSARTALGWFIAVYAALAATAVGYALYEGNVVRVNSEFSGLPLLLLALPWAALFHNVQPHVFASTFNNSVLIMLVFVGVNVALLMAIRAVVKE